MSQLANELPAELIGEIFALCLPEKVSERLDPTKAPMVLCKVSSYWRQAGMSEPRLWDTVIFPSGPKPDSRISFYRYSKFISLGGVDRWFDRCGSNHLLAFGEEPALHHHASHLNEFLPIVTKYARRLKHISIVLTKRKNLETFRRGFPYGIYDNLQSVAISCPLEMTSSQLQAFSHFHTPFNSAPKLTHVSLTLDTASPLRFTFPWSQLSSIEINKVDSPLTFDGWRELLEICPNIQQGTFVNPTMDTDDESAEIFEHQAITRIRFLVGCNVWIDWEMLYRPVRFPNLRHLEFDYRDADSFSAPPMLMRPVTRRALSKIQSLTFHAPTDEPHQIPPDIERIVQQLAEHPKALPSLTQITLPYRNFRLYDIALMLIPRSPTEDHPGLTASVRVVLNGRKEKYNRALENLPEVSNRYRLLGLTRAPCGPENGEEDWVDTDEGSGDAP